MRKFDDRRDDDTLDFHRKIGAPLSEGPFQWFDLQNIFLTAEEKLAAFEFVNSFIREMFGTYSIFSGMFDELPTFYVKNLAKFDQAIPPLTNEYLTSLRKAGFYLI